MPSKRARKASTLHVRRPGGKKPPRPPGQSARGSARGKPARRSATFKSSSWYEAAARVIRISDGTIAQSH